VDDGNGSVIQKYGQHTLTIDHPDRPQIILLNPFAGQTFDTELTVRWRATDPDEDDELEVSLSFMGPGMSQSATLALGQPAIGSWEWDTSSLPDGDHTVRAEVTDGALTQWDEVTFTIHHPRPAELRFVAGSLSLDLDDPEEGDVGELEVEVANDGDLAGSTYVEFYLDDEAVPFDTVEVQLEGGASETVRVFWTALSGEHTLLVRLSTEPERTLSMPVNVKGSVIQDPSDEDDETPWPYLLAVVVVLVVLLGAVLNYRQHRLQKSKEGEYASSTLPHGGPVQPIAPSDHYLQRVPMAPAPAYTPEPAQVPAPDMPPPTSGVAEEPLEMDWGDEDDGDEGTGTDVADQVPTEAPEPVPEAPAAGPWMGPQLGTTVVGCPYCGIQLSAPGTPEPQNITCGGCGGMLQV